MSIPELEKALQIKFGGAKPTGEKDGAPYACEHTWLYIDMGEAINQKNCPNKRANEARSVGRTMVIQITACTEDADFKKIRKYTSIPVISRKSIHTETKSSTNVPKAMAEHGTHTQDRRTVPSEQRT